MSTKGFNKELKEPLIPKEEVEMKNIKTQDKKPKPPQSDNVQASVVEVFKFAFPILWNRSSCCVRFQLFLAFFSLVFSKVMNNAGPIFLKYGVDTLTEDQATAVTISWEQAGTMFEKFIELATTKSWFDNYNPTFWIVLYILSRFLNKLFTEFQNIFFAKGSATCETGISEIVMDHVQRQSLAFHLHRQTGKILRVVSRGAQAFSMVIRILLFQFAPIFLDIGLTISVFFSYYTFYFALIVMAFMGCYLLVTVVIQNWRNKIFIVMNNKDNAFNQKVTDSLLNFQTVKYFNAEDHEERRFQSSLIEFQRANIKYNLSLSVINASQQVVINSGLLIMLLIAVYSINDGTLEVGDFVMINTYMIQLFIPLSYLGTLWRFTQESLVNVGMVFAELKKVERIPEPERPIQPNFKSGRIQFKNVSFTYDKPDIEKPKMILQNVSFSVEPGQSVAIVGPTGSGKSTIMRLLYRFYDVHSGEVNIDGYDVRTMASDDLRSVIAIVPQDCVLFNDNLQYNIGYGGVGEDIHSTENMTKIEKAAQRAKIYDFVMNQHEKWQTAVGERGLRLSGGEKQRVAIARALLKKRALIYCFDEATSALDTTTEREIQEAINEVSAGTTTLMIAHRLSTVKDCDKIIVLKKGVVTEEGKHEELLKLEDGIYRKLWEEQTKKMLEKDDDQQPKEDDDFVPLYCDPHAAQKNP